LGVKKASKRFQKHPVSGIIEGVIGCGAEGFAIDGELLELLTPCGQQNGNPAAFDSNRARLSKWTTCRSTHRSPDRRQLGSGGDWYGFLPCQAPTTTPTP
jgi:hypothetical protein